MIAELRQQHPAASIRDLCRLGGVSRSWLYERANAPDHATRDVSLPDAVEEIVLEFPGYGYRRVTHALARDGWEVNHKRVLRIMRQESLLCHLQRHFVVTTNSQHRRRHYPHLIKDAVIDHLDQVWVAERTFSWFGQARRFSNDYERLPATEEAMIYATMSQLMLRRLARCMTLFRPLLVPESALCRMRVDATKVAEDAIGLFLEYRDVHGCNEETARGASLHEVSEGLHAAEETTVGEVEGVHESIR